MPVPPTYDFGTVRLFEANGIIEAYFPKEDAATRQVVKDMKGFFDGKRRAWRVTPRIAKRETGEIVIAIREALERAAPEAWLKALPTLAKLAATTKRFSLKVGEGGVRVELPPGYKHEWTLKSKVRGASKDGPTWLVPAAFCSAPEVKAMLTDVVLDDKQALSDSIDYLQGFVFSGDLDLADDEAGALGLVPGGMCFADPSFVLATDANLGKEPVLEYPLLCREYAEVGGQDGSSRRSLKFSVITGKEGWTALRTRFSSSMSTRSATLDVRHVKGRWVRRRG